MYNPTDGIFSWNDTVAGPAIQHIRSLDLRIWQGVAVVGFHDDPIAPLLNLNCPGVELPALNLEKMAGNEIEIKR